MITLYFLSFSNLHIKFNLNDCFSNLDKLQTISHSNKFALLLLQGSMPLKFKDHGDMISLS